MRKNIVGLLLLSSLLVGLFAGRQLGRNEIPEMIDFCFDAQGQLYALVEKSSGTHLMQYKDSVLQRDTLLTRGQSGQAIEYRQMEMDSKGYIYLLTATTRRNAMGDGSTQKVIIDEQIRMYESDGTVVRNAISITPQGERLQAYIQSMELLDDTLYAMCVQQNQIEVLTADALHNETPQQFAAFQAEGTAPIEAVAVAQDGSIVYATAEGVLQRYLRGQTTQLFWGGGIAQNFFTSIDGSLYFSERISGTLYRLDTQTNSLDRPYSANAVIFEQDGSTFGDLTQLGMDASGVFYAASARPDYHAVYRFGTQQQQWTWVQNFSFTQFIISAVILTLLVFAILCALYALLCALRGRMRLAHRFVVLFVPLGAILTAVLCIAGVQYAASCRLDATITGAHGAAALLAKSQALTPLFTVNAAQNRVETQYLQSVQQFMQEAKQAQMITGREDACTVYLPIRQKLYAVMDEQGEASWKPIEYMMSHDAAQTAYTLLSMANETQEQPIYAVDPDCNAVRVFHAVYNNAGSCAAIMEINMSRAAVWGQPVLDLTIKCLLFVLPAALLVLLWLCYLLHRLLLPVRVLRNASEHIALGKNAELVPVLSRDELGDISNAFNLLIDRMRAYIAGFDKISQIYMRFIPQQLLELMQHNYITDLEIGTCTQRDLYILCIQLDSAQQQNEQDFFVFLNHHFDSIYAMIHKNNGVIEQYNGMQMLAVFPESAQQAVTAAVQCREYFSMLEVDIHTAVTCGSTLLGVAGNSNRYNFIMVSQELEQLQQITLETLSAGLQHIVTQQIIDTLDAKRFLWRYVGIYGTKADGTPQRIYELLEGLPYYQKKLYLKTRALFEEGVEAYFAGDTAKASRAFTDVASINEKDAVAMYYLKRLHTTDI